MIRTWAWGGARVGASRAWRVFVLVLPGIWVFGMLAWEMCFPAGDHPLQLLSAAPAIACAGADRRQCVLLGGLCASLALLPVGAVERDVEPLTRVGTFCAILAVVGAGYPAAGRRLRLVRELERAREVAAVAQRVVLRPVPPRVDGIVVAADHVSASEGAAVGGDLYDVVATRHGVRVVIGDVRGHGLGAIGTVAAVLGSFREAAHDEPGLDGLLRRLERGLERHLRDRARAEHPASGAGEPDSPLAEEFVTVLLLEVGECGELEVLNCGHPWPYLLSGRRATTMSSAEPLPPLGLFPLPAELRSERCARLLPGDGLFLHTDGAEDARNAAGEFFPLAEALGRSARAPALIPAEVVAGVRRALISHTEGRFVDDIALLTLCNERLRVPVQAGFARRCGWEGRVEAGRAE